MIQSVNLSNSTFEQNLEDDSFWNKNMMLIIESTSYFFYSIIFLIGITGNSIVIYVLLNSVCSSQKYNLNNQYQDGPTQVKRTSFKTKDPSPNNLNNAINNNTNTPNKKKQNVSFKNDSPNNEKNGNTDDLKSENRFVKYSDVGIINEPSPMIQNEYEDTNNKVYSLVTFKNQTNNKSWVSSTLFFFYLYELTQLELIV